MPHIWITEIDEMHDVGVEMNNRYELEAVANAISPILKQVLNKEEMILFRVGVQVYECIDLYNLPQSAFMKIHHAIIQACQDDKELLGHYIQEITEKFKADPRFIA